MLIKSLKLGLLAQLEAEARCLPYEAHWLELDPLGEPERAAWLYQGSRMLYIIRKHLEQRSMDEAYLAAVHMATGGDKAVRRAALVLAGELWSKMQTI